MDIKSESTELMLVSVTDNQITFHKDDDFIIALGRRSFP